MKAFLSIILVTILQIPLLSGIAHTLEENHFVCEDQTVHFDEQHYECEICFLPNSSFVFNSDALEADSIIFNKILINSLDRLSYNFFISTNSSRAPPSVRV